MDRVLSALLFVARLFGGSEPSDCESVRQELRAYKEREAEEARKDAELQLILDDSDPVYPIIRNQ